MSCHMTQGGIAGHVELVAMSAGLTASVSRENAVSTTSMQHTLCTNWTFQEHEADSVLFTHSDDKKCLVYTITYSLGELQCFHKI